MTHVTCRLTAKNRDQLRNPTLGNRVWATFYYLIWLISSYQKTTRVNMISTSRGCNREHQISMRRHKTLAVGQENTRAHWQLKRHYVQQQHQLHSDRWHWRAEIKGATYFPPGVWWSLGCRNDYPVIGGDLVDAHIPPGWEGLILTYSQSTSGSTQPGERPATACSGGVLSTLGIAELCDYARA